MLVQKVGVIGGGQLAWMMAGAAQKLGIDLIVQTPKQDDPAVALSNEVILAAIDDAKATAKLAQHCDVITFENEFINLEDLRELAKKGTIFRPRIEALEPLLDKYQQRCYLKEIGLAVPKFTILNEQLDIESEFSFPVVVKARRHGYDGQGTFIIKNQTELDKFWQQKTGDSMLVEEFISFEKELAVIAARGLGGEVVVYPVVETQQEKQVCHRVIVPAKVPPEVTAEIEKIATQLLNKLEVVGVFGIELFLTKEGKVLVNEIAPRTHNSGHYTLDACEISQFEMHLRAVVGLPLPAPKLNCSGAVMVNLLGYEHSEGDYREKREKLAQIPQTYVHWYGKTVSRPGRKMGHVTILVGGDRGLSAEQTLANKIESIWYG
ncbi:MAG: 5-(carboxyamino)imidazole ribonucleotide synthase [Oscillatoria sp. PMC 1068.18]|nr:5-(carboxyamino)imidazole ribonucleotide synthase [Oscillatoria sp. PMC 1076.18]MEC4991311.1 5-(carboxyamino)imidazole ribonucleotide synthase [Oscillatoria sp. PMC 1068.18]